jgi:hypothetical protein
MIAVAKYQEKQWLNSLATGASVVPGTPRSFWVAAIDRRRPCSAGGGADLLVESGRGQVYAGNRLRILGSTMEFLLVAEFHRRARVSGPSRD